MSVTAETELRVRPTSTIFAPSAHSFRVVPARETQGVHYVHAKGRHGERRTQMLAFAAEKLRDLAGARVVTFGTATRALRALIALATPNAVYPHISAVDDEVNILWLADRISIELSVPEVGEIYVRTTDATGDEDLLGFYLEAPVAELRKRLRRLSDEVQMSNPHWKQVFDK